MSEKFETNRSGELLIITVRGAVTVEQAAATLQQVLAEEVATLHLWDFRKAEPFSLQYNDVEKLRDLAVSLSEGKQWERVAFVSERDLDYGIGRMFQAMGENADLPFTFRVFRDYDEAVAWLGE